MQFSGRCCELQKLTDIRGIVAILQEENLFDENDSRYDGRVAGKDTWGRYIKVVQLGNNQIELRSLGKEAIGPSSELDDLVHVADCRCPDK